MLRSRTSHSVLVMLAMLGTSACEPSSEASAPKEAKAATVEDAAKPADGGARSETKSAGSAAAGESKAAAEAKPAGEPATGDAKAEGDAKAGVEAKAASAGSEGEPPGNPEVITSIDPATVTGLPGEWRPNAEEGEGYFDRKVGRNTVGLYFVQRAFTKAGKEHVLALWGDYEGDEAHGALLVGTAGAWTVQWRKEPVIEDAGTLYSADALLMPVFELGTDRIGVLFRPQIQGCGAAPCRPEDDYVTTTLFEVTDRGLEPRWSLDDGPSCFLEGEDMGIVPPKHICRFAVVKGEGETLDLEVEIQRGKRKKASKTRYRLEADAYVPR